MKLADKVLIPLQPSIFDIHATHHFVQQLLQREPSRVARDLEQWRPITQWLDA